MKNKNKILPGKSVVDAKYFFLKSRGIITLKVTHPPPDEPMQLDKFNEAAQKVLISGQNIARKNHCLAFEPEHLALALIMTTELKQLLRKKNVEFKSIESALLTLISHLPIAIEGHAQFSGRLIQALSVAEASAIAKSHEKILVSDLFLSILENREQFGALGSVFAKYFLNDPAVNPLKQKTVLKLDEDSMLFKVSDNINDQIKSSNMDPVFGRKIECERVIQVLSRKSRNNPVLVGPSGIGRTSIVYALVKKIIAQDVPSHLAGKEVLSLNIGALIAGTTLRGQFEERVAQVLQELSSQKGQYILFVRDLALLMGAGGDGASDAVNLIKPGLAKGDIQLIGLVTPDAYKKRIESDPSFDRYFQTIWIDPPSLEESFTILKGLKEKYEQFHGVFIEDSALSAAIDLGAKHLGGRVLPEVALDILDEACSYCRIRVDGVPETILTHQARVSECALNLETYKTSKSAKASQVKLREEKLRKLEKKQKLLEEKYEKEFAAIESMRAIKNELVQIKSQMVKEKSRGDMKKAAAIDSSKAQSLRASFDLRKKELASINKSARLVDPWVKPDDIAEIVSRQTGIPVQKMLQSEREKLADMENILSASVIGQQKAITAVSNAVRRGRSGLSDPKRPIGSFLFLGPTGVGKTETARTLTSFLFDDEKAMHRFDMSEFMERHSVARLIGAPPGYQGADEGGQLTEKVRRKPYSVLLFDEIEKAHVDVLNLLLQVLDDGRLSDSKGNLVSFANTVIIMTSNIGSDILLRSHDQSAPNKNLREDIMQRLLESLRPEFVNRIDEVVLFEPIKRKNISQIARLMLNNVEKRVASLGLKLKITPDVENHLAELGYSPEFGARPLKRTIQRLIENPLSMSLIKGEFDSKKTVVVTISEDKVICFN